MTKQIILSEHERITEKEDRERLASLGIEEFSTIPDNNGNLHYLGISKDYVAGYYIGACNLDKDTSLVILPKIDKIGYLQMLLVAFRTRKATDYFSSRFKILFDEPLIESGVENDYLTPLLIASFVNSVTRIIKNGLKRGYVIRDDNLTGKVRGKICINLNQKSNIQRGRLERAYCRYQEYSFDIPENRLLKKALDFSQRYITSICCPGLDDLMSSISRLLLSFSEVSCIDSAFSITKMKYNAVFREYSTAINLAKLILKRFDFCLSESDKNIRNIPVHWIDMPALFEVYVYSLLDEIYPGQIVFQAEGSHLTRADFIKKDEGIILDAKYKLRYQNSNTSIIDDVRELSGYARDEKLLGLMGHHNEDYIPPCVIIYPDNKGQLNFNHCTDISSQLQDANRISGYLKFFKFGIMLPASGRIDTDNLDAK